MKPSLKKELPVIAIILLPFIYLAYIWRELPARIPIHWNMQGEIDRYGSRSELIIVVFALPVLIYLILLIVPLIDPKYKIKNMGNKYQGLKMVTTLFMSVLAMYIIWSVKNASFFNPNNIFLLLGMLYSILGNYMKTIRANYFVGIRTPWTLEKETVWKATHRLGGVLWFAGGLIIVAGSLVLGQKANFIFFMVVTGIIVLVPVVYSYVKFKEEEKRVQSS